MNAKELFDNLGYTTIEESPTQIIYIKKNPDDRALFDYRVVFNLELKTFGVADDWGDAYPISISLLEAIVYQIKELKWLWNARQPISS